MKKNSPLVSIIIPVYNGEKYVRDAINSALAQTYKNVEIIVVNDGSVDHTDQILKSYGNKIRYFKKENGGVASAINYGISKMRGEYFSWLSHDDLYMPQKVESEINYLVQNNLLHKNVMLYSDFAIVDRKGKLITNTIINHNLVQKKPQYALLRGLVNGNSILIPKTAFDTYGLLDTNLACTQDYDKWFEISKTYPWHHVPEVLIASRYHAGQTTNTSPKVRTEGNVLWLKMIKSVSPINRIKLNGSDYNFYYQLCEYLKNTPYDEAYKYCKDNLSNYPTENVDIEEYVTFSAKLFSANKLIAFCQFTHREGLSNALRRVKNKILKKH